MPLPYSVCIHELYVKPQFMIALAVDMVYNKRKNERWNQYVFQGLFFQDHHC